jgi:hypothetical protein
MREAVMNGMDGWTVFFLGAHDPECEMPIEGHVCVAVEA